MEQSNRKIIHGAIMSYLMIGLNVISSMIYTPWVVRSLGQADYAIYTLVLSIISLFILDFGFSTIVSRYVAIYKAENQPEKINALITFYYKIFFCFDLFLAAGMLVLYLNLAQFYTSFSPAQLQRLEIAFAVTVFASVFNFMFTPLKSVLTAHEEFARIKLVDIINKIIIMGCVVLALSLGQGLYALVIINALANVLSSFLFYRATKRNCTIQYQAIAYDKPFRSEIYAWGIFATIATFSENMLYNVVPSILAVVATTATVAIYGVVNNFHIYVYLFTDALSGLFLPRVSRITAHWQKNGDSSELLSLMIQVGRLQVSIVGLLLCGYTIVGQEFMVAWMGVDYQSAYLCALWVILPTILELPQTIASTAVVTAGYMKDWAMVSLVVFAINAVGCVVLGFYFGVYGASISLCCACLLRFILRNWLYKKRLNLPLKPFFIQCYRSFIPTFFITMALGLFFAAQIAQTGWIGVLLKGSITTLIYSILLYTTALNATEKSMIHLLLTKLCRVISARR